MGGHSDFGIATVPSADHGAGLQVVGADPA